MSNENVIMFLLMIILVLYLRMDCFVVNATILPTSDCTMLMSQSKESSEKKRHDNWHPHTTPRLRIRILLGVIGHEYFHNWTGNRVTVRDWFQLTLKEGTYALNTIRYRAVRYADGVHRMEHRCICVRVRVWRDCSRERATLWY
jgi:Peptidase family M1 domain